MKTFKLHLIRHGLTQGNLDGIFVGGGMDIPVCDAGVAQLHQLAREHRYPAVGMVFSSPMIRATQTADILYPDVAERIILEDLRESRFGVFEGLSPRDDYDGRLNDWLNPESDFTPEGGESGRDFAQRTARALMQMMQHLARNDISQAACVTHGGVIMAMLTQAAMPRKPFYEWMTDNGCGFTVQADAAMLMRDGIVEATQVIPEGYMNPPRHPPRWA